MYIVDAFLLCQRMQLLINLVYYCYLCLVCQLPLAWWLDCWSKYLNPVIHMANLLYKPSLVICCPPCRASSNLWLIVIELNCWLPKASWKIGAIHRFVICIEVLDCAHILSYSYSTVINYLSIIPYVIIVII